MRQAVAITVVALLTTAVTCAEPARQTQPSPSASTITLTSTDCIPEGLSGALQRSFVAAVVHDVVKGCIPSAPAAGWPQFSRARVTYHQRQQGIAAGKTHTCSSAETVHSLSQVSRQRGGSRARSSVYIRLLCRRCPDRQTEDIYIKGRSSR